MTKRLKFGITGVNHRNGNRGVGALAISTFYLLDKIAKEKNYKIEITVINSNYGKDIVDLGEDIITINSILTVNIFYLRGLLKLLIKPKYQMSFYTYIKLDYVLCMGEGDSFSDIYGINRFQAINNQHRLSRLFKKKYVLLPQTIGPFYDKKINKQANLSIEKAKLVFARDFQSFKYVTENTNQNEIYESIDVAFFMPYERKQFCPDFLHVGLNISALLWHGGYTQNNQFGLKCNYQKLINKIVNFFLTIPNIKVHIVPHVVLLQSNIENDYELSYNYVDKYNDERIILAPFFLNPIHAKNYISGLDFFAGARMHSVIAAFSSGVPVFPMAYSRKFNGLFQDTLNYQYLGDMVNENMKTIFNGLKYAFDKKNDLAEIIKTRLDTVVKEREKQLVEKLSQIFT